MGRTGRCWNAFTAGWARRPAWASCPCPSRRDGRTLQAVAGQFWEVVPWLPGTAPDRVPLSRGQVRAGFALLAAFHQTLARHATSGPSPNLQARCGELEGLLGAGFDRLAAVLDRAGEDPLVAPVREWLERAARRAPALVPELRHASAAEVTLQPCLRDVRPEHLLFLKERVGGLVDFGAMGIDTVAADLARLSSEWLAEDRALGAEALASYAAIRPLDSVETALIGAFERSAALLGGGHWVRWHFVDGRRFEDATAVARGLAHGLERLARLAVNR